MRARLPVWMAIALAVVCVAGPAGTAYASTDSTYAAWTAGPPNDTSLGTPHSDFQLTTVKCAVCHAVHKGEPGGQLLLRTTVADACTYCHSHTCTGILPASTTYNHANANTYTNTYSGASGGNHQPCGWQYYN